MNKDIWVLPDSRVDAATELSSPSSGGNGSTASTPTAPAEDYKVGPGHPPKEYQWPKGTSGNKKGRPPKQSALSSILSLIEEILEEKVTLKHGEKLTKLQTGLTQLSNDFAKGDRYARRDLFYVLERVGFDFKTNHRKELEEALAPEHQAILDAYVARRTQTAAPSKSSRVLAPAELLDDDIDVPEGRHDERTEVAKTPAADLPPDVLTILG